MQIAPAHSADPSAGSEEGPVALAKRVLRFFKERTESCPPLFAGKWPVQIVAENVLRRASSLAGWGFLPVQLSSLSAQATPDESLPGQTEISISFLHDGSSAADTALKAVERLASDLHSIIETNDEGPENSTDHVTVGAVDVSVTPLRIVGNDNEGNNVKLSSAQNIVVVLHDDLTLSAALVALSKSYFSGHVSRQRIQIVLPVPELPSVAPDHKDRNGLDCDAAMDEAIKRLVDAKADAGVIRLVGDIGRVHLMTEVSDPSRALVSDPSVVVYDARDYQLVQLLHSLFPTAKGARLPASRKSVKSPLILPADRTHAVGAQVNEGEEKTRPVEEDPEDKTAAEVAASSSERLGDAPQQSAMSDGSNSKSMKPPPPPAKKKANTTPITAGGAECEAKPSQITSEELPAVPVRKKKGKLADAAAQRGQVSSTPAASRSCESQRSMFIPKPSAAFFQVRSCFCGQVLFM